MQYTTKNEIETQKAGALFAEKLKAGDIVIFDGDLGAGKTEFIRGICNYFEIEESVTSPTFSIINYYNTASFEAEIYHIDLYRIEKETELIEIGFDDILFNNNDIKLIEWYQNAGTKLSNYDYKVTLKNNDNNMNSRDIYIEINHSTGKTK